MDLEDLLVSSLSSQGERIQLLCPAYPACWPHQARIENIGMIGRHEYLNVPTWVKAVEFRSNLQHGP
jgi:hypothetical protein